MPAHPAWGARGRAGPSRPQCLLLGTPSVTRVHWGCCSDGLCSHCPYSAGCTSRVTGCPNTWSAKSQCPALLRALSQRSALAQLPWSLASSPRGDRTGA